MITLLVHINTVDSVNLAVEEMPKTSIVAVFGRKTRARTQNEKALELKKMSAQFRSLGSITFVEALLTPPNVVHFSLLLRND